MRAVDAEALSRCKHSPNDVARTRMCPSATKVTKLRLFHLLDEYRSSLIHRSVRFGFQFRVDVGRAGGAGEFLVVDILRDFSGDVE